MTREIPPPQDSEANQDIRSPFMDIREAIPGIDQGYRIHKGKVRDTVDLGDNLLIVASDRISTFDSVHPNGIPEKGKILTEMTKGWYDVLPQFKSNHLVTSEYAQFPAPFNTAAVEGRSMLVRKLTMFPVELIVRGYITGSGLAEYNKTGAVSGIKLPAGLRESDRLPEPLFTPSTKADVGHDVNIDFDTMVTLIHERFPNRDARALANELKRRSIERYIAAAEYALPRGIIIADTKFEEGINESGDIELGDEVITPDSSRFWPVVGYEPGHVQNSFDKQYVRDYGTSIGWDRKPPAPYLPQEVIVKTIEKYREAKRMLFG